MSTCPSTVDLADLAEAEWHDRTVARQIKRDIRNDLLFAAHRIPPQERDWLSLNEIAVAYARVSGGFERDQTRYIAVIESLMRAIYQGKFVDARGRSHIADLSEDPSCPYRFNHNMAADHEYFQQMVKSDDLWIRRTDALEFFRGLNVPFPGELGHEGTHNQKVPAGEAIDSNPVVKKNRLPSRPLGKDGRPNTVTAAWDVYGKLWPSGTPPHWSELELAKNLNAQLEMLRTKGQFDPDDYDHLKMNSNGKYTISADSVGRALVPRRPRCP
jgi:hypothetical protein